ncbi:MAG: hypothetical protein WA864_10990 [Acetobacteraceae bacterium]|jgi:hypothetical protein
MAPNAYQPGESAPSSGRYQEVNIFGAPTGTLVLMTEGEKLPPAPRGFTWRPLSDRSASELREEAAKYRRMAETATTKSVMDGLRRIAERLDILADQKERESRGES